jgi:hypothetical protein
MTYHVEADTTIRNIVAATFPDYHGRKFRISVSDTPLNVRSYWDGGSRRFYRFVNLATLEASAQVPVQSMFDPEIKGADNVTLPEGFACVEHSIFCGQDTGITIHIRPENSAGLLPAPIELTREQRIVLIATRSFKSSYQGISNYRFHEAHSVTGITLDSWNLAKSQLQAKGLLDARGALTFHGKNAAGRDSLHSLREEK